MIDLCAIFGFQKGDRVSTPGWKERQPGSTPPPNLNMFKDSVFIGFPRNNPFVT